MTIQKSAENENQNSSFSHARPLALAGRDITVSCSRALKNVNSRDVSRTLSPVSGISHPASCIVSVSVNLHPRPRIQAPNFFQMSLRDGFGTMLESMSYGLQIDFSAYDPSNYFHSLKVFPQEGDDIRTFEELGTGQEQLLALAFSYAFAKGFYRGIILVVKEP